MIHVGTVYEPFTNPRGPVYDSQSKRVLFTLTSHALHIGTAWESHGKRVFRTRFVHDSHRKLLQCAQES
eukprot:9196622-Pyramimonas_sp.AAC.1